MGPPFTVKKFLDAGTANPIVARLGLGVLNLVGFTSIERAKRMQLSECAVQCLEPAVRAERAAHRVMRACDALASAAQSAEATIQVGQTTSVGGIGRKDVVAFLQNAMSTLDQSFRMFDVLWSQRFDVAHFAAMIEWANQKLRPDDHLLALLVRERPWIEHLVAVHDEAQHPKSGTSLLSDFTVSREETGNALFCAPQLFDGTDVRQFISAANENLLTFVEGLNLLAVSRWLHPAVRVMEIPEAQRRKGCPERFAFVANDARSLPMEMREHLAGIQPREPFAGPPPVSAMFQGYRFRAVGNRMYPRPPTETFHEFLIDVLKIAFGERWLRQQAARPVEERHAVSRWLKAMGEQVQAFRPQGHQAGQRFALIPTGEIQELTALGWDLYTLQRMISLPERLMRRLRHPSEFQGARYEVAVAGTFVRCGFSIEWNSDTTTRGPEFTAENRLTGDAIGVEAKSRRRPGTLNERGLPQDHSAIDTDVRALVERAIGQDPGDKPFAIFVDVNAPNDIPGLQERLWDDTKRVIDDFVSRGLDRDPFSLLAVTNGGWHYESNRPIASGASYRVVVGKDPKFPIKNEAAILAVVEALGRLGRVPDDG